MTTIAELVTTLEAKDQPQEVEYVVVKPSGELVAMSVSPQTAKDMIKLLKRMVD